MCCNQASQVAIATGMVAWNTVIALEKQVLWQQNLYMQCNNGLAGSVISLNSDND